MPANEKGLPSDRTDAGTSNESELVGLYQGFSKEKLEGGKASLGHATLSVWAAAFILCSVLVFGLYQVRSWLQGVQKTLEQARQDNKLLLEGLDELLARTEQPDRQAETELPPTEQPPDEKKQVKAEKSEPGTLTRRYKIYYRTQAGEDLAKISEKFGVSEDQLRLWNALKATDSLLPGQVLVINKSTQAEKPIEVAQASPQADNRKVAKREEPSPSGPPPQGIVSDHPPQTETKGDDTAAGETAVDAAGSGEGPAGAPAAGGEGPSPDTAERVADEPVDETVHVVRQGESLSSIGQRFGVSWVTLAAVNGIEPPGTIYVGQRLKIPEISETAATSLPTSEVTYKVQEGDNLYRIGRIYDMSWEQIARANGITQPSRLYVGQVLKIPVAKGGPEP